MSVYLCVSVSVYLYEWHRSSRASQSVLTADAIYTVLADKGLERVSSEMGMLAAQTAKNTTHCACACVYHQEKEKKERKTDWWLYCLAFCPNVQWLVHSVLLNAGYYHKAQSYMLYIFFSFLREICSGSCKRPLCQSRLSWLSCDLCTQLKWKLIRWTAHTFITVTDYKQFQRWAMKK